MREAHERIEARRNLDQLDNLAAAIGAYKGGSRQFSEHRQSLVKQAFPQLEKPAEHPLRAIKKRLKKS